MPTSGIEPEVDSVRRRGSVVVAAQVATLLAIMVAGAILVRVAFFPRQAAPIDTQHRSGTHLLFVFAAPTGELAQEDRELIADARTAMRSLAASSGYLYSTVGISIAWDVEEGLRQLAQFGHFDEVVVGRNWLNTGIGTYVRPGGDVPSVPQIGMFLQTVNVSTRPAQIGQPRSVFRVRGIDEVRFWRDRNFALPAGIDGG